MFSPDGKTIMSSSDAGTCFWDITTGNLIRQLSVYDVAVSPDWKTLVGTGDDGNTFGSISLWNLSDDEPLRTISSLPKAHYYAYAPDGKTYVTKHEDGKIHLWDTKTEKIIQTYSGHISGIWFLSYSPDGNTLATAGWDSTVLLWDLPQ